MMTTNHRSAYGVRRDRAAGSSAAVRPDAGAKEPVVSGRPAPKNPAVRQVTVAMFAGDPITGRGAAAYLSRCEEVKLLAQAQRHEAEVCLLLVDSITEDVLEWMRNVAEAATAPARFVLVGNDLRAHHLHEAIGYGLVTVIPRREADFDRVVRAICAIRDGRVELPEDPASWVVDRLRSIQRDVLGPRNLNLTGLESREVEVLRLLSEGHDTGEIARRLNYSERTVKNIIHGILARFHLRNRVHAVAFAIRNGAF
jgi:DNA-binding NarL/FixJ family response regulator